MYQEFQHIGPEIISCTIFTMTDDHLGSRCPAVRLLWKWKLTSANWCLEIKRWNGWMWYNSDKWLWFQEKMRWMNYRNHNQLPKNKSIIEAYNGDDYLEISLINEWILVWIIKKHCWHDCNSPLIRLLRLILFAQLKK